MVTLAKLCLVMTVVLGLAFASPRPTLSRNQDTGDKNEGEKPGLPSPELRCPEKDFNLTGHDIDMEAGIKSWSDCGSLCMLKAKTCEYWTWDEAGQKCYLKSDYTAGTNDDGMFSGKRGCVE